MPRRNLLRKLLDHRLVGCGKRWGLVFHRNYDYCKPDARNLQNGWAGVHSIVRRCHRLLSLRADHDRVYTAGRWDDRCRRYSSVHGVPIDGNPGEPAGFDPACRAERVSLFVCRLSFLHMPTRRIQSTPSWTLLGRAAIASNSRGQKIATAGTGVILEKSPVRQTLFPLTALKSLFRWNRA